MRDEGDVGTSPPRRGGRLVAALVYGGATVAVLAAPTLARRLGRRMPAPAADTAAAATLQRAGLVEYRRGLITVLDRRGLESFACACYAADRHAYSERLR